MVVARGRCSTAAPLLALLLIQIAGGTIALPAGRQAAVPARRTLHQLSASRGGLPSWVKMHQPQRPYSQKEYERNVAEVAAMKRARRRYDLVLWGDSMASAMKSDRKKVWDRVFRGYEAEPLSMVGSNMQETTWRIVAGGERPSPDPKVAAVMCGYINKRWRKDDPAPMMDWLVRWLKSNLRDSVVVVVAVPPVRPVDMTAINKAYKAIARKHGVVFVDISKGYNPLNPAHSEDGTHPLPAGQAVLLRNLKRALKRYM